MQSRRARVGYKMKYEGPYKRLDVTTYVIQLYDVVKCKFLYDKTRHEHSRTAVTSQEGQEENPRALQRNFKSD